MRNTAIAWASALFLAAGSALARETPNDAQIAGIVVAANQVDITAGKLAKDKASNKEVKDFANQMVTDHTGSNQAAEALAKKLNLKPEQSQTSTGLHFGGNENIKKLKTLKGADFDKAYIDHEVTYHQTVLDTIDNTLLPDVKNSELKELLTKTRPVIADHLEHAKKIQASLGK